VCTLYYSHTTNSVVIPVDSVDVFVSATQLACEGVAATRMTVLKMLMREVQVRYQHSYNTHYMFCMGRF
jgi:hypothetical protein